MTDQAPALFQALEGSALGATIRQSLWIYPAANVGHIVALVCFAGAVAVMDIRLLGGLWATSPVRVIRRARRVAMIAFAGMVATGFVLFTAEASHVVLNPVFQFKMALVAAGLANIAIYEVWGKRAVYGLAPNAAMPARAKAAGALSLAIWIVVAASGRSIAYF
jgi:hypothetical protein